MPGISFFLLRVLIEASSAHAQPQYPELRFTVVRNERGKPMRGRLIDSEALRGMEHKPKAEPWSVQMYFTVSTDFPYAFRKSGDREQWFRHGSPLRGGLQKRLEFSILDCFCVDQYFLIRQGQEVMRIDLPDPGEERTLLYQHVLARSGYSASPEVIQFRPGRFNYAELLAGHEKLEARMAHKDRR